VALAAEVPVVVVLVVVGSLTI